MENGLEAKRAVAIAHVRVMGTLGMDRSRCFRHVLSVKADTTVNAGRQ